MKTVKKFLLPVLLTGLICYNCGSNSSTQNNIDDFNQRPSITSASQVTAYEDSLFSYNVTYSDTDGPSNTITYINTPGWLSCSGTLARGVVPWGSTDTSFTVIVSDNSLADSLEVTVTVTQSDLFYLGFRPRSTTINSGDDITLTLSINSVTDLFAIYFDVSFDTSIIEIDTVVISDNGILQPSSTIYFYNGISGGLSISMGKMQTAGADDVSGGGPICEITFTGIGTGSTDIDLSNVHIIDEGGGANLNLDSLETISATITIE